MKFDRVFVMCAALLVAGVSGVLAEAPASAPAVAVGSNVADQPSPKGRDGVIDKNFEARHEKYVELAKKGGIDLYFIGDSITDGWHGSGKEVWKKEFAGWNAENFGIGGDRTQHVLWRLENGELDGVKPKVFVMMIGTNNLGGNTDDQIVAGNAAIIKELETTNPQAKILLLGIFPRWANRAPKGEEQSEKTMDRIKLINEKLAKLDDGKNVKFFDFGDKFLAADGTLPKGIMPDGLHPNAKGYEIWAEAIEPKVKELLK